jgi:MFS family permease
MGLPLGRKNCILLGNLCVIIGGSLQASAWSIPQIIIGRVVCVSSIYPVGLSQIEADQMQGFGIGVCSLMTLGIEIHATDNS